MKKLISLFLFLVPCLCFADVFSDAYRILENNPKFDVLAGIKSLEKMDPSVHINAESDRVILVYGDEMILDESGSDYGKITSDIISLIRERNDAMKSDYDASVIANVFDSVLSANKIDGYYISDDFYNNKLLTGLGIDGGMCAPDKYCVSGVFNGSVADNAGLEPNDIITHVNGNIVSGESLSGLDSGTLKLTVLNRKNITLKRASVMTVDADIVIRNERENNKKILELIVHNISENAASIIHNAIMDNMDANGIILDLRSATGTDENAAAQLAGLFIGKQDVMQINDDYVVSANGDKITDKNMIVLINSATNKMAEVLAYAIYENKRGILIGTPSAGNTKVETRYDIDGGALILNDKIVKSAFGKTINERGIFPIVCLSKMNGTSQQNAFFVNVLNDNFNARDFNTDEKMDVKKIRNACPEFVNGRDEDAAALGVSVKILLGDGMYNGIMGL